MESRICATDRLRREGRWAEASLRRDELRQQYQLEGLTRRESSERAWRDISVQFPPLTEHQIEWLAAYRFMCMAAFPPDCEGMADAKGEPPLGAVWWAFCHCLGRLTRLAKQDWKGAQRVTADMLVTDIDGVDDLLDCAISEPVYFLQSMVADKLERVAQRLTNGLPSIRFHGLTPEFLWRKRLARFVISPPSRLVGTRMTGLIGELDVTELMTGE